jgi:8-oxo-dGTP pyrophosphatase MutT (NUDIX family)
VRSRPPVVVYVTREHPQTAVDQLLVFDIVDKHAFQAVVPGGGIEDGETVEEAAKREALEETGIRGRDRPRASRGRREPLRAGGAGRRESRRVGAREDAR